MDKFCISITCGNFKNNNCHCKFRLKFWESFKRIHTNKYSDRFRKNLNKFLMGISKNISEILQVSDTKVWGNFCIRFVKVSSPSYWDK